MTKEEFLKRLPELVRQYKPAPEVLQHISYINLLIIIGPSGVGKTTLINHLGIPYVPSDTTRDPRPGEKEGVDFYFRTDYDQVTEDIKAGRFVQIAVDPVGELKATKYTSYPRSGTAVMTVVADAIPVFRRLGFKNITYVFTIPPSYEEWMRRLSIQSLTKTQMAQKIEEAKRSLDFALSDDQTHFVLNGDIHTAAVEVQAIMRGESIKEAEQSTRHVAESLLARLNQA